MKRAVVWAGSILFVIAVAPPGATAGQLALHEVRTIRGLSVSADTTYEVNADEGEVAVRVEMSCTNNMTSISHGGYVVTRYYYSGVQVAVPTGISDLRAVTSSGKAVKVSILEEYEPADAYVVEVDFGRKIWSGETAKVTLMYNLVGGAPRSEGLFRINPAYVWFYAWAFGDEGESSVSISVDKSMDTEVVGGNMRASSVDGQTIYEETSIPDPSGWFVMFTARDDTKLAETRLETELGPITVKSWEEDTEWASSVAETLEIGFPLLADLIGIDWPLEEIEICQSYTPTVYGYGGWYLHGEGLIEIGEQLNPKVTLHEIAHSWINSTEFGSRWIAEGLVEEFAYRTLLEMGWEADEPMIPNSAVAFPLADWRSPSTFQESADYEMYGYTASWWVIHEISEEIGIDRLAELMAVSFSDLIVYQGDGGPEKVGKVDDWQRMLDLFEHLGGSNRAVDLFVSFVAGRDELRLIREREVVRAKYLEIEERAGEWGLPISIRLPMSDWDFDVASKQLDIAVEILDTRDQIEAIAQKTGVAGLSLEPEFEASEDLGLLVPLVDKDLEAARAIDEAHGLIDSRESLLVKVGLLFTNVGGHFDSAADLYRAGEYDRVVEEARRIVDSYEAAAGRGVGWLVGGFGVLAVGGVGIWWVRRRRTWVSVDLDPDCEQIMTWVDDGGG